jgi:hypothetical protein
MQRCRRLLAHTARVPGVGSDEGDRAARLALTIQIVAKQAPLRSGRTIQSDRIGGPSLAIPIREIRSYLLPLCVIARSP